MKVFYSFLMFSVTLILSTNVEAAEIRFDQSPPGPFDVKCAGEGENRGLISIDGKKATSELSLEVIVGREGLESGAPKNGTFIMNDKSTPPLNITLNSEIIGSKQLKDSTELYAFFKSHLQRYYHEWMISDMVKIPALYPVSIVVGRTVWPAKGNKKAAKFIWFAVSGLLLRDGYSDTYHDRTFVMLMTDETVLSRGFITCDYVADENKK